MTSQRWRIMGIGLLSSLAIAGCASTQGEKKLYDRLGGLPSWTTSSVE